jgi:hypothetical protein
MRGFSGRPWSTLLGVLRSPLKNPIVLTRVNQFDTSQLGAHKPCKLVDFADLLPQSVRSRSQAHFHFQTVGRVTMLTFFYREFPRSHPPKHRQRWAFRPQHRGDIP